ncbi:MAG TPA: GNAT family N-acetyltransferase [Phytomonospora sp.]
MNETPLKIVTDRLTLRPFSVDGARAMVDGDPGGRDWAEGYPPADDVDVDVARMYLGRPASDDLGRRFGPWEITWTATGQAIGGVGLFGPPDENGRTEVGYGVVPVFQGKGVATEALLGLLAASSGVAGFTTVVASTAHDNPGSRKVLDKAGFGYARAEEEKRHYTRALG